MGTHSDHHINISPSVITAVKIKVCLSQHRFCLGNRSVLHLFVSTAVACFLRTEREWNSEIMWSLFWFQLLYISLFLGQTYSVSAWGLTKCQQCISKINNVAHISAEAVQKTLFTLCARLSRWGLVNESGWLNDMPCTLWCQINSVLIALASRLSGGNCGARRRLGGTASTLGVITLRPLLLNGSI